MLSVTLPTIADQTVLVGAPLHLALDVSGTNNPVSYTVSVDNANVSATVPTGNKYLKLHVQDPVNGIDGDMVFELFNDLAPNTAANIKNLIDRTPNFYNGLTFHRVIANFMIQGGDPNGDGTGGPGYKFDDEFNANLQFTGPGLLAMANSGDDTNGSQFFITAAPYRAGDFSYTIFGMLVSGEDVRQQIANVPVHDNGHGEVSSPNNPVTIASATILTEYQAGVLRLSAPLGSSGTSLVTVTATDTVTLETSIRQFTATVAADTTNDPPFLNSIAPIQTPYNTPVTFNIPAIDVEGDAIYYDGIVSPANANLTLVVDHATGSATLTPSASLAPGVYSILLGVAASSSSSYNTQYVPVYVNPAAPTSVQLLAASDTGSSDSDRVTNLNNSVGKTLQFQVNGVISGAEVELFADGVSIGQAVASGSTVVITTNGSVTLTEGSHAITAKQTLPDRAVSVGNLQTTVDLVSNSSSSLSVIVDTTAPQFTFTPITTASIGIAYNCQAGVIGDLAGTIAFSLTQAPTGMAVNATTGLITWTPPTGQTTPVQVTLRAADRAGNTNDTSFSIDIVPPNNPPVLTPASPALGTVDENTPVTIGLAAFINNGAGTTTVTDADSSAVVGGIALIGLAGQGSWAYTLDGTTYTSITSVSASSALLLPHNASLRYTPDNKNAETATITYRAWDTTTGASGGRINISLPELVGGNTAFSAETDTASLAVTAVNDAPVLVPAQPSLGTIAPNAVKTYQLADFINDGAGSTTITDVDASAVLGGIAVTGLSGSGTWEYSLDGSTFTAVGTVSAAAVLLLPHGAALRYTAGSSFSDSPSVTYRAWDATAGTGGAKVDLSATGAVGGTTPYSIATDSASITLAGASLSGYVYLDSNNDGLRTSSGATDLGLPGVPVKLFLKDTSGNWNEVAGKSPVLTAADGSYRFENLVAGTYRIQEVQPANYLDGKETAGTVGGATRGTVAADTFEVQLGGGEIGTGYNFGERGIRPEKITLRMLLASAPTGSQAVVQANAAPVLDLSKSLPGNGFTATFPTGGATVALAAADALAADADSPMLAWMKVTLTNPLDGSAETLSATVTNTALVSSYANGVLTLAGAADLATYTQVLKTLKYANSAATPQIAERNIQIVVNDGIADSIPAAAKLATTQQAAQAAADSLFHLTADWLLN